MAGIYTRNGYTHIECVGVVVSHDVWRDVWCQRYYYGSCSGRPGSHWLVDSGAGTKWAGLSAFYISVLDSEVHSQA